MTLKEIRIIKGLTQVQCAEILGVSRRTYQTMEKDDSNKNKKYYEKLINFSKDNFFTNVIVGKDLKKLTDKVKNFKKRYCYKYLIDYISKDYYGKVCILYGLRRTGKTTLLFQLVNDLDLSKVAYIKAKESNNMGELVKDINVLKTLGYKYLLIDEITLLSDFINSAATLSDIYSMLGLKIILTGTDSLGFAFADKDELYDRNVMIHTSYISFKEFSEILLKDDVDTYIEYGGTLKSENMSFDDIDYKNDDVSFLDEESTRKYIDSSISRNIQKSLQNNKYGAYFASLRELYENNELTNVINRIIEDMNHRFLKSVIDESFKSHDLGSARQMLLKNESRVVQTALYDIDNEKVHKRLKELLDIKDKEERKLEVDGKVLSQIKEYLVLLDLIKIVKWKYDNGQEEYIIFTQPGMRYSVTKALVYSLLQDDYFLSLKNKEKELITNKILEDVKGRMLEDIVLFETLYKKKDHHIFKYKFISGGEFDMVDIYDGSASLYEVKHTESISFEEQTKYLNNGDMIDKLINSGLKIKDKFVLYRGENKTVNDIKYLNVGEYLKGL